jgi:hypothetical protein
MITVVEAPPLRSIRQSGSKMRKSPAEAYLDNRFDSLHKKVPELESFFLGYRTKVEFLREDGVVSPW